MLLTEWITLKFIDKQDTCFRLSLVFWHLRYSVATRLRCDEIFNNPFITRFLQSPLVKKLRRCKNLAKFWTRIDWPVFWLTGYFSMLNVAPFRRISKVFSASILPASFVFFVLCSITLLQFCPLFLAFSAHFSTVLLSVYAPGRVRAIYTLCPKKLWSRTLATTLSNLNRFQKFLHCCKEKEISNKPFVIILTTP